MGLWSFTRPKRVVPEQVTARTVPASRALSTLISSQSALLHFTSLSSPYPCHVARHGHCLVCFVCCGYMQLVTRMSSGRSRNVVLSRLETVSRSFQSHDIPVNDFFHPSSSYHRTCHSNRPNCQLALPDKATGLEEACPATQFQLDDLPYSNYFYMDCRSASQVVVTSPLSESNLTMIGPRLLVSARHGSGVLIYCYS